MLKIDNFNENFISALSCGTEMLELDCHMTSDGQVVVSHDAHLSRTANLDAHIWDIPFLDLPLLNETQNLDFNRSVSISSESMDRKIPLLSEVFEKFPDTPINIDIKHHDQRLIKAVSKLVREYQRENLTVWGNFSDETCKECYKEV